MDEQRAALKLAQAPNVKIRSTGAVISPPKIGGFSMAIRARCMVGRLPFKLETGGNRTDGNLGSCGSTSAPFARRPAEDRRYFAKELSINRSEGEGMTLL
jgi:hypothetical protein